MQTFFYKMEEADIKREFANSIFQKQRHISTKEKKLKVWNLMLQCLVERIHISTANYIKRTKK